MQSVGLFCIALVIGWLTVQIVYPHALASRAAGMRVILTILVAAAAGMLLMKFGATANQLISAVSGLATGLTGCAVLRRRVDTHSEN